MPFRKPSVVLFIVLAIFTVFSLISAQSDTPLPLPPEPDGGNAQFQDRSSIELLTNGGFEIDLDSDKLPDSWKAKNTDVAKSDKLKCNKPDKIVAYNGNCAFQFSGNPTGEESKLSQDIPAIESIVNDGTLTLSAYVDPKSGVVGSKIASLKVKLSDSSKLKLDLRSPSASAVSDYTQLTDTLLIAIPTGVVITEAKLDLKYGETSGKYLIDDVSLSVSMPDPTATPVTSTESPPTETAIFTSTVTSTSTIELNATHTVTSTDTPTDMLTNTVTETPSNTATSTNTATDTPSSTPTSTNTATDTPSSTPTSTNTATDTPSTTPTSTNTATEMPSNTPTSTPPIQQLVADNGASYDFFGGSVSLSADGNTALVGSYRTTVGTNTYQGSAYLYALRDGIWMQQAQLVANDGASNDAFGRSVSLSADGSTALVGAYNHTVNGKAKQGSAYVYTLSGGVWTQQSELVASDGASKDAFGYEVSLSADGNIALVGAYNDTVNGNAEQGSAYVFTRSGGVWTQQTQLVASDGMSEDGFGYSVSLSADGNTAIVGAAFDRIGGNLEQGSTYVYTRSGSVWTQQAQLIASDGTKFDYFGASVSLSADGNTALIGRTYNPILTTPDEESAYIYTRSSGVWTEQTHLTASDGMSNDYFGRSISLSADGNTALVGAAQDTVGSNFYQGSVYLYTRNGSVWMQQTQLLASSVGAYDWFGVSVDLSADGNTALVGASNDSIGSNSSQGSAWVFSNTSNLPVLSPTVMPSTSQEPLTPTPFLTETPTATSTATATRTPTSTLPPGVTLTNTPFVMATQPPSGGGE